MKNYLKKSQVSSLRKGKLGIISVLLKNGSRLQTKRSSKGQYVILNGKRKYIPQGITY